VAAQERAQVVDLVGQTGEQGSDGGVVATGLGDQVQGAGLAEELRDVQGLARLGQNGCRQVRVGEECQGPAHGHADRGDGLVGLAAHLGQLVGQVGCRASR